MVMIIEMLGAPGAGKTTLVPRVEDFYSFQGKQTFTAETAARPFAARTVPGRFLHALLPGALKRKAMWAVFRTVSGWHSARFAMSHPTLSMYVWRSQRGRHAEADSRSRRVLYWYFRSMGTYSFVATYGRPGEVVVIDEGFSHRAVQLHASAVETPTAQAIARYVDLLPCPDLAVHVMAPAEVCRSRVKSRGVWERLADRPSAELDRFIRNAHVTVGLTRDALEAAGWNVVDVDNQVGDVAHCDLGTQLAHWSSSAVDATG